MSEYGVKENWRKHWETQSNIDSPASFVGIRLRQMRLNILEEIISHFDKNHSVIDLGCGSGSTLSIFREAGFINSIGIDFIPDALDRCSKNGFIIGKDVFLKDAKDTNYQDQQFDIVFSEGLWEHFEDPYPHIVETARIAKKYIVVIQPNHHSFFGRLMLIGWKLFSSERGGVKEYSFKLTYFEEVLQGLGFKLVLDRATHLKEQAILVFERICEGQIKNTDEIEDKISLWEQYYKTYKPTILGELAYKSHRRVLEKVLDELDLPKNIKLLDVGCGKCSTTKFFRDQGYFNSIGIDLAESGLVICEELGLVRGKDVFKFDATDTPYPDKNFKLVFGEGILEHYENFMPFVSEMCRISKDYIIIVQPNHYSIYGRFMKIGWLLFKKDSGGVEELSYRLNVFHEAFVKYGFKKVLVRFTPLRENAVIVYRRLSDE